MTEFTFHYVSIKSVEYDDEPTAVMNLHSTMYLLNLCVMCKCQPGDLDLHSTMYLLNREYGWNDAGGATAFTFHYVSIKSDVTRLDGEGVYTFTFHYVSIKSFSAVCNKL